MYHSLVFGPRSGPTIWGRSAAFLGRITQALLGDEGRAEVFVDNPAIALRGSEERCNELAVLTCWLWRVMGFPLSWSKAQLGKRVDWIGASIEIKVDAVLVQPQPSKITSAAALTIQLAKRPIVTVKQLQSYAGQLNFMAGIVPYIYPFVHPLWAVIYDIIRG